jgi:hypothetical protein
VRLRTDAAGGIGVLVRQSAAGCYLLRFDAPAGRRELVRVAGASETVLWSDATIGIDTSGEHLVTLDCVGARLSGWLDGRPLFAVEDPDALPAGRIGLRAEANAGARFAEVQVGPPAWVTLHELADEETLPAGARLRLHTGSPDVAPAPAAGVRARFAASAGEQGLARLPASGARLRVVGSDGAGAPGHERDIRPAADFADVPATDLRMLRRADGTAFFLHRATGPLDPDAYRLTLTFRRDNTTRDPESPILSQAGSTAAEVVTLDIRLAGP